MPIPKICNPWKLQTALQTPINAELLMPRYHHFNLASYSLRELDIVVPSSNLRGVSVAGAGGGGETVSRKLTEL